MISQAILQNLAGMFDGIYPFLERANWWRRLSQPVAEVPYQLIRMAQLRFGREFTYTGRT
jgi:hypothetical protein